MELIYARWLGWCTAIALAVLAATFVVYVLELAEPLIALERLPEVWRLSVDRFAGVTGAPAGWGWLAVAGKGDYANLAGVALLGLVTLVCYLRILPVLVRRGERVLALVAAAQIAVLVAAASGWLAGGH